MPAIAHVPRDSTLVLSVAGVADIRRARPSPRKGETGAWSRTWMSLVKEANYRPSEKEPFMNERQRDYFRHKLLDWKEDILQGGQETLQHLQDENRKPLRPGRPRLVGDRPGDRTAHARPPAQADCQDRRGHPAHRRRHLRLLRRDRRADRAQAPRRTPDRDPFARGAGTPRAARTRLPRRLTQDPARALARYRGGRPSRLAISRSRLSNAGVSVGEPSGLGSGAGRGSGRAAAPVSDAAPARFSDLA